MKIGILTYHWVYNFGAQLQVLTTVNALRQMGHEPVVINFIHTDLREGHYEKLVPEAQQKAHIDYMNKYLPLSKECNNEEELVQVVDELGIKNIVVGSDAIFFIQYPESRFADTRFPTIYWMDWVKKCKFGNEMRIYALSASSMGTNFIRIPGRIRKALQKSLSNFRQVYIRDEWTRYFVKWVSLSRKVKRSPDPVMSFNKCVDPELLKDVKSPVEGKYVLYGFGLSEGAAHEKELSYIKEKLNAQGYKFVALPFPEECWNDLDDEKIDKAINPLEWYKLIANSAGYIGEKFHPVVVSITNKVPFFAIDRNGDRVSKRFLIPIRLKFQSKTWDLCRKFGFKDAHLPMSLMKGYDLDKIVAKITTDKWNYSKSEPQAQKLWDTIAGFDFAE
jgi:hypothetical protein